MMEVIVSPARASLLKEMAPATREVAEKYESTLGKSNKIKVGAAYELGLAVAEITEDEDKYGKNAIVLLAEYLNIPGGPAMLYRFKKFSENFAAEFVATWAGRLNSKGKELSLAHWLCFADIEDEEKRQEAVFDALNRSLSVAELELETKKDGSDSAAATRAVRGRKIKLPTSPLSALKRHQIIFKKAAKYSAAFMKSSLPQFSKITDEKTKEACKDVLVEYTGQLDELVEHIQKVKEELVEKLNEFTEGKPAAAVAKRGRPRKKVK
jgi:hypothetical protein